MNLIFIVLACGLVALLCWVVWVCLRPMTFCLTFDDGIKAHATIVGPLLRQRGWVGAFNVPTSIVGGCSLTGEQVKDLCLEGNESERMSWDDVRGLINAGHEVYPHTCDHADLPTLERAQRLDEIERQVGESRRVFVEQTGTVPRFFCLPHNACTSTVAAVIRRNGMEPFACFRPNFGKYEEGVSNRDITKYLLARYWYGARHVDIMIHGIERLKGGWMPFEDGADFIRFLDEVAALEQSGKIRVVAYSRAHSFCPQDNLFVRRYLWLAMKFRRAYFKFRKCEMCN